MIVRKPFSRSPNPYANPLGRQSPEQRMQRLPSLIEAARQDRRTSKNSEVVTGDFGIGPPLYNRILEDSGLPILVKTTTSTIPSKSKDLRTTLK